MSTFASTYIHFPSKVAEIAILVWGGGVYCFAAGLLLVLFVREASRRVFLSSVHRNRQGLWNETKKHVRGSALLGGQRMRGS